MGREIELKFPLTDSQYSNILAIIKGEKPLDGVEVQQGLVHLSKSDSYFSRFDSDEERKKSGEPRVIRLRTEAVLDNPSAVEHKSYFCIKYKTIKDGLEFNSENETFVEDAEPLLTFFTVAGYKKYFEKNKESYAVYCKSRVDVEVLFHVELVIVNGHKYLEVEVTQATLEPERIRKALEAFVSLFGMNLAEKDSRSWMEIIRSAEK